MPLNAYTAILQPLPLLAGLETQEKDALLQQGRLRNCAAGQMLFLHGQPVTHFYIILSGTIKLFRTSPDGSEKTIDVLKSGQTMCESEIMDSCHNHRVNALPVDDSVVLEFPLAWVKQAARTHHVFALNLLSMIAHQAHQAELEAEQQASMSAAQLVACFLQRLCVLYDFNPKDFELPYSKGLIASRLGMELETFSRALAKLKDRGIAVEGNHVSIHDLAAIEDYVCAFCSVSEECATHKVIEGKLNRP
jgi:CRP-like cAMP-binding protein